MVYFGLLNRLDSPYRDLGDLGDEGLGDAFWDDGDLENVFFSNPMSRLLPFLASILL